MFPLTPELRKVLEAPRVATSVLEPAEGWIIPWVFRPDAGDTTVSPPPRSTILANCAIALGPIPAQTGSAACEHALDAATVLMDRSPDPPAAGATAGSSARAL